MLRKNAWRFRFWLLACIPLLATGCGGGDAPANNIASPGASSASPGQGDETPQNKPAAEDKPGSPVIQLLGHNAVSESPAAKAGQGELPEVCIKTSLGDIYVRLNSDKAPATVDNFLSNYANRQRRNRRKFYRTPKLSRLSKNRCCAK